MVTPITKRQMTLTEREYLESTIKSSPTNIKRWMEGAQNALVMWAVLMFVLLIGWLIITWLVGFVSSWEIGLSNPYAIWFVIIGVPVCALYAIYSSVKWVREWEDFRPLLKTDLAKGEVYDENYHIVEAKRFQEPEHGGLIYFLHTVDNRVLVLYDHESQELSLNEQDPFSSSFQPCSVLNIVRAPKTNFFIKQKFSGSVINVGDTFELLVPPEQWPEQDSWCDIPWDDLEQKLQLA